MRLGDGDKAILQGEQGEARRLAMEIMVELGDLFGAEEMLPVSHVHIDSTNCNAALLDFVDHLAGLGGRLAGPATINPAAVDLAAPHTIRFPDARIRDAHRMARAYGALGVQPCWTCAPYQDGYTPRFGETIAWSESNAICFANSVLGARTARFPDLADVCVALLGRTPRFDLYLPERRGAQLVFRLEGFARDDFADPALLPLLGYHVGSLAGERVPVIEGVAPEIAQADLKGLCAAAASSGAVPLLHVVGVTPEAHTLEMACRSRPPEVEALVRPADIGAAEERLTTATTSDLDLVTLGCPHFSYTEFVTLERLLAGRRVAGGIQCWVFTSRSIFNWVQASGMRARLEGLGLKIISDPCAIIFPNEAWGFKVLMTNSVKAANYCFSQVGTRAAFGSLAECVESAVNGRITRSAHAWR